MFGFTIVWIGQIVSVLASNMSGFALSIWMFEKTHSATAMGLMQVAFILPFLLLSPLAGVWVDRYNRKLMMMISDLVAILATFAVLILQATGHLQFWHLYVANVFYGLGNTFQWPAYSAAITTMIPKEQYGRANGLMSLLEAGPGVLAPLVAGAILATSKTHGLTIVLAIDVTTFFLALGALLIVHVPQPVKTVEGQQEIRQSLEGSSLRIHLYLQAPQPARAADDLPIREPFLDDCFYCLRPDDPAAHQ